MPEFPLPSDGVVFSIGEPDEGVDELPVPVFDPDIDGFGLGADAPCPPGAAEPPVPVLGVEDEGVDGSADPAPIDDPEELTPPDVDGVGVVDSAIDEPDLDILEDGEDPALAGAAGVSELPPPLTDADELSDPDVDPAAVPGPVFADDVFVLSLSIRLTPFHKSVAYLKDYLTIRYK